MQKNLRFMETIFEHSVTPLELKKLFGPICADLTREGILKFNLTQREHHEHIYKLYTLRGNKAIADKYAAKMPNDARKTLNVCLHDFAKI